MSVFITWTCFTALPILTFRQQEQGACRLATSISRGTFQDKRRWCNIQSLEGGGAGPKDSTPNQAVIPTVPTDAGGLTVSGVVKTRKRKFQKKLNIQV